MNILGHYASLHYAAFGSYGDFTSPQIQVSYPLTLQFWYFLPGGSYKFEVYLKTGRFNSGRIWKSNRSDKVVGKWTHVTLNIAKQTESFQVKLIGQIKTGTWNYLQQYICLTRVTGDAKIKIELISSGLLFQG